MNTSNGGSEGGGSSGKNVGDVLEPRVLREYALVADGERGALSGPDGSAAWLCVPRRDSPAVRTAVGDFEVFAQCAPG
jgi:hypothetical protein